MTSKRSELEMIGVRAAAAAGLPNDIETALRRHLRERPDDQHIFTWVNNENRMMVTITHANDTQSDFVAVGNQLISWPIKPPTQSVGVRGFEAFRSTTKR